MNIKSKHSANSYLSANGIVLAWITFINAQIIQLKQFAIISNPNTNVLGKWSNVPALLSAQTMYPVTLDVYRNQVLIKIVNPIA